jgi:hypothetical protein
LPQILKLYRLDLPIVLSGEVMVAIWWGTQADEVFPEAWHSDTGGNVMFRSKTYLSPKLWYLRVNVIEAQDLNHNYNINYF